MAGRCSPPGGRIAGMGRRTPIGGLVGVCVLGATGGFAGVGVAGAELPGVAVGIGLRRPGGRRTPRADGVVPLPEVWPWRATGGGAGRAGAFLSWYRVCLTAHDGALCPASARALISSTFRSRSSIRRRLSSRNCEDAPCLSRVVLMCGIWSRSFFFNPVIRFVADTLLIQRISVSAEPTIYALPFARVRPVKSRFFEVIWAAVFGRITIATVLSEPCCL